MENEDTNETKQTNKVSLDENHLSKILAEPSAGTTEALLKSKILEYQIELEKARTSEHELKVANDRFRILMLSPIQMDKLTENAVFSIATNTLFIGARKSGWEQCQDDTLLVYLDLYEKHVQCFLEILNARKGKILIERELLLRRKKENKTFSDKLTGEAKVKAEKARRMSAPASPKVKLSPEEKALRAIMAMGASRQEAEQQLKGMQKKSEGIN